MLFPYRKTDFFTIINMKTLLYCPHYVIVTNEKKINYRKNEQSSYEWVIHSPQRKAGSMTDLKFIYDYRDIPEYRHSFNELANITFGINFETWHGKGGWNDRYICYSYARGSKVVANLSINKMDLILEGKSKKAIQIGTVMTHPDYRNRGLAADLMNRVLEEYEKNYDFIYLFANESVLKFYPKFGFTGIWESQISMDIDIKQSVPHHLKKLDISNDFNIIYRLTGRRCPLSKISGVNNDQHLLLFYCLYVFHDSLYYSEDKDFIVIFSYEGDKLLFYDIIGENEG
jgi:GNAT superfamily N-acetyltransferase